MIWRPKPGDRVRVRYKDHGRPLDGRFGMIAYAGKGKDTLVYFDDGHKAVIPRRNLVEIKEDT